MAEVWLISRQIHDPKIKTTYGNDNLILIKSLIDSFKWSALTRNRKRWMDGWMVDLPFYVFLTVFQSYQGEVWMTMKGCVQWNPVYG